MVVIILILVIFYNKKKKPCRFLVLHDLKKNKENLVLHWRL